MLVFLWPGAFWAYVSGLNSTSWLLDRCMSWVHPNCTLKWGWKDRYALSPLTSHAVVPVGRNIMHMGWQGAAACSGWCLCCTIHTSRPRVMVADGLQLLCSDTASVKTVGIQIWASPKLSVAAITCYPMLAKLWIQLKLLTLQKSRYRFKTCESFHSFFRSKSATVAMLFFHLKRNGCVMDSALGCHSIEVSTHTSVKRLSSQLYASTMSSLPTACLQEVPQSSSRVQWTRCPAGCNQGCPWRAVLWCQVHWRGKPTAGGSVTNVHPKKREGGNREIISFSSRPPPPKQALKWWLKDHFFILDLQGQEALYLLFLKENIVLQQYFL